MMAEAKHHDWKELCRAASETRDSNELLRIVRELNDVLENEEQMRRGLRLGLGANKSGQEAQSS